MRFAVLIKGILRGMGHEAACELLATKTVEPGVSVAVYSHCAVIDAPHDLPDGDYEVEFEGEVAITRLHEGCWQVGRVIPRTYAEASAFFANEARRFWATMRGQAARPPAIGAPRKLRSSS